MIKILTVVSRWINFLTETRQIFIKIDSITFRIRPFILAEGKNYANNS